VRLLQLFLPVRLQWHRFLQRRIHWNSYRKNKRTFRIRKTQHRKSWMNFNQNWIPLLKNFPGWKISWSKRVRKLSRRRMIWKLLRKRRKSSMRPWSSASNICMKRAVVQQQWKRLWHPVTFPVCWHRQNIPSRFTNMIGNSFRNTQIRYSRLKIFRKNWSQRCLIFRILKTNTSSRKTLWILRSHPRRIRYQI